jgi:hypothetical protein
VSDFNPSIGGLRRIVARGQVPKAASCDLCASPLAEGHAHLFETATRKTVCACQACGILFPSRAQARFRRIPTRVVMLNDFDPTGELWAALEIPVDLAFLALAGSEKVPVASYPSPAGTLPGVIHREAWNRLRNAHPVLDSLEEDVEAVLVRLRGQDREAFVVPVDLCHELSGLVRLRWKGLSGGTEVRTAIDAFFDRLRGRARPVEVRRA